MWPKATIHNHDAVGVGGRHWHEKDYSSGCAMETTLWYSLYWLTCILFECWELISASTLCCDNLQDQDQVHLHCTLCKEVYLQESAPSIAALIWQSIPNNSQGSWRSSKGGDEGKAHPLVWSMHLVLGGTLLVTMEVPQWPLKTDRSLIFLHKDF